MDLTKDQLHFYDANGYLCLENIFSAEEIRPMLDEFEKLSQMEAASRILEKNGKVRSVFIENDTNEVFKNVIRQSKVLEPAKQILRSDVYAHQVKINSKMANGGDYWPWHQDFIFWNKEDNMRLPRVTNAVIYLQEVNEFNGPMYLVPGSHRSGMIDVEPNKYDPETHNEVEISYQNSTTYMPNLTADLKYTIENETLKDIISKNGLFAAKGAAGSVLFFDSNLLHASPANLSPWDRIMLFISYNSVENQLGSQSNPRPEFLANRNFTALQPREQSADSAVLTS